MANPLMVMLGCDCDPDRPRYGGVRYDDHLSQQKWRGITEGLSFLRECLKNVEKEAGLNVKLVLCVRSDIQMNEIYGAASWPLSQYCAVWREMEAEGHEVAWHPHLWRWSEKWGCWFQETQDSHWIISCLKTGFSEFSRQFGKPPTTCHTGWTFHNNTTMTKIAELGVKLDFSACPGVYYEGGPGDDGTVLDNKIDWLGTPQKWYRPSAVDYRRPAAGEEQELPIVEIPKFTSQATILKKAKALASRGKKSGGQTGIAAFLQITMLPILYSRIIKERLEYREAEPFFATYFHPDELLPDRRRSARSFLYSLDNLEKNLLTLVTVARKKGREVTFVTGAEALGHLRASTNG